MEVDENAGKDDPLENIDTYAIKMPKQVLNLWISLQNCKSGQLNLSSEFIPLTNQQAIEEYTKSALEENSPNQTNISAFNEDLDKDKDLGDANINLNENFMDQNNKWINLKNYQSSATPHTDDYADLAKGNMTQLHNVPNQHKNDAFQVQVQHVSWYLSNTNFSNIMTDKNVNNLEFKKGGLSPPRVDPRWDKKIPVQFPDGSTTPGSPYFPISSTPSCELSSSGSTLQRAPYSPITDTPQRAPYSPISDQEENPETNDNNCQSQEL